MSSSTICATQGYVTLLNIYSQLEYIWIFKDRMFVLETLVFCVKIDGYSSKHAVIWGLDIEWW